MKRFLLALLVCATGCLNPDEPGVEIETYAPLPFAEIGRGRQALVDTVYRTVRSSAEWAALQDSLVPLMPFSAVNFELEMVVLAAVPVPTGGYDLRFEEFEDVGDSIIGHYRFYLPGQDCRPTMGAGNTFQVVRMARSDKTVNFERISEALDCTPP